MKHEKKHHHHKRIPTQTTLHLRHHKRRITFHGKVTAKGEHRKMPVPSGTVALVDTVSGNTVAKATLDSSGNYSISWTSVPGTYNFVANYSGDTNFDPSQSAAVPDTVNPVLQPSTTTLNMTPAIPQVAGTSVTFSGTVS